VGVAVPPTKQSEWRELLQFVAKRERSKQGWLHSSRHSTTYYFACSLSAGVLSTSSVRDTLANQSPKRHTCAYGRRLVTTAE
jgi:predicted SprT family Zn-dependent metalloprotease